MLVESFRSADRRDHAAVQLGTAPIEGLRRRLEGNLLEPDSPGYEEARRIWNAMIDRRPALIAQCRSTRDVREAVLFARDNHVLTSVRGGGHNIAGSAVCEGGLMIDLSLMRGVEVDAESRWARVEGGVTLGEFDTGAQAYGLATPLGINSTTGVAGLTLGGGFGWLSRRYGLTIDNLVGAEVVTADGEIRRASDSENPDLFWAIRGGGGNFGIVTSFEFALHRVGPEVLSGLIIHPFDGAAAVLEQYREITAKAPDPLTCWVVMRQAPPLPFLAPEHHGSKVVVLALLYAGPVAEGERAVEPLRRIGKPLAEALGPQPYLQFQSTFDPLLARGARNYWKSNNFGSLGTDTIAALLKQAAKLPTFGCELFLGHLGGAVRRVPEDATAYAQRDAEYVLNIHARWESVAQDKVCTDWARDTFRETAPSATGGVYVNFLNQDEGSRVVAAYGPHFARLMALKRKFDPENLFRFNQNIPPAAHA